MSEKSIESLLTEAKSGKASSCFALAEAFYLGLDVEACLKTGSSWYEKGLSYASEDLKSKKNIKDLGLCLSEDDKDSNWYLASFFHHRKDERRKLAWQGKSAELEHAVGQFAVGIEADKEGDHALAFEWFRKSADQCYAKAQYHLAAYYRYGKAVEVDLEKAFYWCSQAAEQAYAPAECGLGICYRYGLGTDADFEEAFRWYQKSADQGYAQSLCNQGTCYEAGEGTKKDLNKAFKYYEKSAWKGYMQAQWNLALCYEHGKGVQVDLNKALIWYEKAAEQKHAKSLAKLKNIRGR